VKLRGKLASTTAIALGVLALAGTAPAHATDDVSSSQVLASHGLGARPPKKHVAPKVSMRAMDAPPASFDLRAWAMTPGNQGAVGSCVTWAIDYGMLGWYYKYTGRGTVAFQPMYTYSQINGGGDNGSWPTDALDVAQTQGSDTQAHYSHSNFDWYDQPNASEHANAAKYKIAGYETLFAGAGDPANADLLKNAISNYQPVAIIIPVRHGFDYLTSDPDDVDTDYSSSIRGYHEVLAIAYDEAGLIIENSWTTGWANGGFGRMSWDVVNHDVMEGDVITALADPVAPSVSTPAVAAQASGSTSDGTLTYKATWSGSQGSTGAITSYDAEYQIDGGAYAPVALSSETATQFTLDAQIGHPYRVRVRANADDLVGAWKYSATFTPTLIEESNGKVSYSGSWSGHGAANASSARVKLSSAKGNTATLTATGRNFAWVATKATSRGSAQVYVDGKLKTTINTHANSVSSQQVVYVINFGSSASHNIKIVNVATAGHPAVDVDAFVVS
jgi:hypothetical protein